MLYFVLILAGVFTVGIVGGIVNNVRKVVRNFAEFKNSFSRPYGGDFTSNSVRH